MKTCVYKTECPNCKVTISIPYIEPVGIPFPGEIDMEITRAWVENLLRTDKLSVREYDAIIRGLDEEEAEIMEKMKEERLSGKRDSYS